MTQEEVFYGIHPVVAVLEEQRRRVVKLLLHGGGRQGAVVQRIIALATQQRIPIEYVDGAQLSRITGHRHHQGVVALAAFPQAADFADMLVSLQNDQEPQTVLVLDQITDVGNLAALMRAADAFGVRNIVVPRHHSVALSPTVAKRSAGASERVAVVQVVNVARALAMLQQAGFWVYGADMCAAVPVSRVVWPQRVVLVLGAEDRGMRRLVRESCDTLVRIPMRAGVDSLNVAVAGAIFLAYLWDGRAGGPGAS